MKRSLFLLSSALLVMLFVRSSRAQDTTVVQTLTYDSLGRAGVFHFPESGSFEKVLLQYRMRCHHALISTSQNTEQGCGQWDYNCETYIWDSTRTDSLQNKWPSLTVTNWPNYTNFPYTKIPTFNLIHDSLGHVDTVWNAPDTIVEYRIGFNDGFHQNDTVVAVDTIFGRYPATKSYTLNDTGKKVDSVSVAAMDTLKPLTFRYFTRGPQKFELMSFVTPYGIGLDLGKDGKMYQFDATDYLPVMKGWKRLTMERGSGQEEFDLRFLFISGTPTRNVLDMQQLWPMTEESYQTIQADDRYQPISVQLDPAAQGFKLRSYITGHGGTPNGLNGEFTAQTHYLSVGPKKFERLVWKECDINPMIAQGGTWPLDRAGWCPGMATDLAEYELTGTVTPGSNVMMDYGVEGGVGDSRYDPSTQLVSYGAPNFKHDAAIVEIWRPTDRFEFAKFNPVCDMPIVVLKNNGSLPLDSVQIDYHVDGGPHATYAWHGKLNFLDTISIALPVDSLSFWTSKDSLTFHADLTNIEGSNTDEYDPNNHYTSLYTRPPSYTGVVVVNTVMNKDPTSYYLSVTDFQGNEVFGRGDFTVGTTYYDSLVLPVGCYTISMTDANDQGLAWWADPNLGTGALRLRQTSKTGKILKTFNPDFGAFTQMDFSIVQASAAVNEGAVPFQHIAIYPNPAHNIAHVELDGYPMQMVTIEIIDEQGSVRHREQRITNDAAGLRADVDLSSLPRGSYFMRLTTKDGTTAQPISLE